MEHPDYVVMWPRRAGRTEFMQRTAEKFNAAYLGDFTPTPAPLYELAAEYHRRAEEYDRTVCTGPIRHGSIMPATHREMWLINTNALALRQELTRRAVDMGFTAAQLREEIQRYA